MKAKIILIIILNCIGKLLFCQQLPLSSEKCKFEYPVWGESGTCYNGEWKLVFEDEFEGSQLDLSKWENWGNSWNRCHDNSSDGYEEPQAYLGENVTLAGGILTLNFKEDPGNYSNCEGTTKWKQYTSGAIYSNHSFLYGLYEAEIKIPSGTDFFPAFWLFSGGGEIDIFEFYDDEDKPNFTVWNRINSPSQECKEIYTGIDYSADYHTYSLYWDPFFIAFYIDGVIKHMEWLYYSSDFLAGIPCEFVNPNYLYAKRKAFPPREGEQILLNFAGQKFTHPSPLPHDMKIKNVRVWQRDACLDKTVTPTSDSIFNPSFLSGKVITTEGNVVLKYWRYANFVAGEKIVLKPGFHVMREAIFKAEINPDLCIGQSAMNSGIADAPKINIEQLDPVKNLVKIKSGDIEKVPVKPKFYPNPVTNELFVESTEEGIFTVTEISGKVICSQRLTGSLTKVDMGNYSKGFYFVKLVIGNQVYTEKILKQ